MLECAALSADTHCSRFSQDKLVQNNNTENTQKSTNAETHRTEKKHTHTYFVTHCAMHAEHFHKPWAKKHIKLLLCSCFLPVFCLPSLWSTHPSAPLFLPFTPHHLVSPDPLLCLLSSPLLLFLFPLHSLMLGLSYQNDPCAEPGGAGLQAANHKTRTNEWGESLLALYILLWTRGGRRRGKLADREAWRGSLFLFLCVCRVCVYSMCVCVRVSECWNIASTVEEVF